ncbi:MAG: methionyl-tRNA formyltransferase [Planctomycetota bacterium]
MRLAFLGSGEFGLPTLKLLAQKHSVVGVVSQPDRPAGRGGKLTATPIGAWAAQSLTDVPLVKPEDVNEPGVTALVRSWAFDVMVVIAFGQKLSPPLLAGVKAINLHASLLPRWRGAAPINWAILGGDTETGNSVISLADRMDAGLIYAQSKRAIPMDVTAGELHDQLSADGPELVGGVLDAFAAGTAQGRPQDETLKTRAPKLSREMAVIDLAGSAEECRRRINGLSPWPGVTVRFRGESLKVLRATVGEGAVGEAGAIVDPGQGLVSCGQGVLKLLEVQPPGKRAMAWRDFANGHNVKSQEVMLGGLAC